MFNLRFIVPDVNGSRTPRVVRKADREQPLKEMDTTQLSDLLSKELNDAHTLTSRLEKKMERITTIQNLLRGGGVGTSLVS